MKGKRTKKLYCIPQFCLLPNPYLILGFWFWLMGAWKMENLASRVFKMLYQLVQKIRVDSET